MTITDLRQATETDRRRALSELASLVAAELAYDGDKPLYDSLDLVLEGLYAAHLDPQTARKWFLLLSGEVHDLQAAETGGRAWRDAEANVATWLDRLLGRAS